MELTLALQLLHYAAKEFRIGFQVLPDGSAEKGWRTLCCRVRILTGIGYTSAYCGEKAACPGIYELALTCKNTLNPGMQGAERLWGQIRSAPDARRREHRIPE